VLAQRLMRVLCTACGGTGCVACHGSGYRGRRAIAELVRMDDELRDLIAFIRGEAAVRPVDSAAGAR
jgi:general secretion pathway protein E